MYLSDGRYRLYSSSLASHLLINLPNLKQSSRRCTRVFNFAARSLLFLGTPSRAIINPNDPRIIIDLGWPPRNMLTTELIMNKNSRRVKSPSRRNIFYVSCYYNAVQVFTVSLLETVSSPTVPAYLNYSLDFMSMNFRQTPVMINSLIPPYRGTVFSIHTLVNYFFFFQLPAWSLSVHWNCKFLGLR